MHGERGHGEKGDEMLVESHAMTKARSSARGGLSRRSGADS
jgi:hypothetical protein